MTSGYQRLRVRGGESEPEQQTWVADGTAPYPAWKYGGSMLVKSWRILIEASLVVIILILAFAPSQFPDRTATLVSLPTMPPFSSHGVMFVSDETFVSVDALSNKTHLHETMRKWTVLSTPTRGMIDIDPTNRRGLAEPYRVPFKQAEGAEGYYMVSVFHQLHCLSELQRTYALLFIEGQPPEDLEHPAHCFDYLRQAILCAGDTTIEGSTSYGPGWGIEHNCKNMDEVRRWATNHANPSWRLAFQDYV